MMKDVIIKIDQNSMVYKQETVLGISYENLQGKIIFKFLGTFPKGIAYLEYERDTEKGYLQMNQVGEEYQLEIKSSLLTKEGRIYLQLRVTEDATPEGTPVFKSNKFYLEVKEAINATTEIPDEYPEWIDTANEKIKEMDNLNITTERVEDGVDIVLTDKKGNTTRTEVKDGAPGPVGPQGAPGAVKMQVVDTLPETGETDTIYLVKKDNPGEQNLYDEYVYTDTGWEHIGDTSVDLSNYYTKNETDNKIFESIPVFSLSDSEINFKSNEWSTDSNTIENINKIINNNLGKFVTIVIRSTKPGQSQYVVQLNMCFDSPTALKGNTNQYITGIYITNEDSISGVVSTKQFKLTYNVKEIGKINIIQLTSPLSNTKVSLTNNRDVLTKNNITAYNPTSDYNPATKKYVDDNAKTYTAGDNITISEDNVISASGGNTNYIMNTSDYYNDVFSEANIEIIKKWYADYRKGKKPSLSITMRNREDNFKYYNYELYMVGATNPSRSEPDPHDITLSMRAFYKFGSDVGCYIAHINIETDDSYNVTNVSGTNSNGSLKQTYYSDISIYGTKASNYNCSVLKTTNISAYTPTSDYNPATKKYVDDQVGNINTVLATLTTVSEVTK